MRSFSTILSVVLLAASPVAAELSKAHRILVERGIQIQAQAFYQPKEVGIDNYVFDPKPYLDANFTSINWHTSPLNVAFAKMHPTFPWARWSMQTGNSDLEPAELPYKDTFIALQYKDENSLNNPDIRADFKAWFDAARPKYPNTILFTNQLAFDATDANLAEYLRESKPDMLCMDSYRWKVGNIEGARTLLSDMQRYRRWALAGHDGSGKQPIPYALYPQTFHGENMWRDPSESELRLNHFAAWALGYTFTSCFTYNYGTTALFTGADTTRPTPTYQQLKEINRQGHNLGPALVRLISKGVVFVPGAGSQAPIDMDVYPASFGQMTGKDPHIRGVAGVTNLGKTNGGQPGDVLISWFQVLDESFDGDAAREEWYFMVTNALISPTGSAADTRQRVELNFASSGGASLQRLSRNTGKIEDVPLDIIPKTDGRRRLVLELEGGTADLFKFKTGAPFVGMADGPPVAPRKTVIDDYHGTKIDDPYRYFENFADPAVQTWVKGQAEYADRVLSAIPGRDNLLARVRELDEGAPYRIRNVKRWRDGGLHYLKRLASENLDKLYFRAAPDAPERLLIDPERLTKADGTHYSISFCVPSPDRQYIVYGLAAAGSEQTVLHVLDVAARKDLPDVIDRMEADYTEPCWLPHSMRFVYSRRQKLTADSPATAGYKNTRAYLHRLGDDPDHDALIFAADSPNAVPMTDEDFPSVVLTPRSKYAIGKIKHGDTPELTLYATPLGRLGRPTVKWSKICDVKDEVKDFAVRGSDIYLLAAGGAPRYRILKTSLAKPQPENLQTVVPEGEHVIESIAAAREALYVGLLDAGISAAARVPFAKDAGAKLSRIETPAGMTSAYPFGANPDTDGTFVGTASWTRAGRIYVYEPTSNTLDDTGLAPKGKFDEPQGYESREVRVKSHNGVEVPLSIIHKSGIKLDGSNPTLVSGYGSYGFAEHVYFDPKDLAWLERSGVLAVAHVRGGGAFGKQWHLAGRMANKPNTWKDFIACCEYLVREGYTSPAKLAGQGGSAGGITLGRAITERPDLYAAAIINVGVSDPLRAELTTNGVPNIKEFGTFTTKPGFDALLAMSPYHHVKDGTKYPAVLLTHGINDPRVDAWMSAKMTARLQATSTSGKPVLFRVDYKAGHGIGSTKTQRQEQLADEWAFLFWQMGVKPD